VSRKNKIRLGILAGYLPARVWVYTCGDPAWFAPLYDLAIVVIVLFLTSFIKEWDEN